VRLLAADPRRRRLHGQERRPQLDRLRLPQAARAGLDRHLRVQLPVPVLGDVLESRRPEPDVHQAAGVQDAQQGLGHQVRQRRAPGDLHLHLRGDHPHRANGQRGELSSTS
jgi:hypothetical protein